MRTPTILAGLVLCAAVATGCGEAAPEEQAAEGPSVDRRRAAGPARPGPVRPALRGSRRQGRLGRHDAEGAVRARRRCRDPRARPAAGVAEHLLRHHRGLQGQAGVVQARPARPSAGCAAASSSPTSRRPDRRGPPGVGSASTPMEAELIGRDDELRRVQRFVEAVPSGARALLIAGEAGVGKTSLWQAAVDRARAAGMRAVAARPAEAETSFAYAALGDLLGSHPAVLDELPGPQRRALEVALRVAEHGEEPDQQAVALATLAALRALARAAPLVVAIDDVQWLDRPSAAVLGFAARRLADEPIALLIAQRTASAAPAPLDLDRALAERSPRPPRAGPAQPRRRPAHPAAQARLDPVPPDAPPGPRALGREPVLRAGARARGAGGIAAPGARRAAPGHARGARRRPAARPLTRCPPRARGGGVDAPADAGGGERRRRRRRARRGRGGADRPRLATASSPSPIRCSPRAPMPRRIRRRAAPCTPRSPSG